MENHKRQGKCMEEFSLKYVEQYGVGFMVKRLTAEEVNQMLRCQTLVNAIRMQLIEKSRNDDCEIYMMLDCDTYGGGWYFGYKYPDSLDITPFEKLDKSFKEVFRL